MIDEFFLKAFEYGPFAALCFALIFYMRKDHRQDYMGVTNRLNEVEDYQKNKMTETLTENTQVITRNTEAMREVKQVLHHCHSQRTNEED